MPYLHFDYSALSDCDVFAFAVFKIIIDTIHYVSLSLITFLSNRCVEMCWKNHLRIESRLYVELTLE